MAVFRVEKTKDFTVMSNHHLRNTELSFWQAFAEGNYQPGLLFDDADILPRIEHHPMALWKCGGRVPKQKDTPAL